jgi:hypothetical protein
LAAKIARDLYRRKDRSSDRDIVARTIGAYSSSNSKNVRGCAFRAFASCLHDATPESSGRKLAGDQMGGWYARNHSRHTIPERRRCSTPCGRSSALAAVLRAGAAMVDSRLVNKPIRSPPTASNGPKRPFPCGLRKARLNDSSHHGRRSLSKISAHYVTATTRRDLDASADHFQVYTGQVRMGTIYKRESRGSTNIVRNTSGSKASFLPRCRWARAASTSPTASRVCSARSCAMPRPSVAIRSAVSSS